MSMLSFRRPAGSKTEAEFIGKFIKPLGTTVDAYGNHILQIGNDPAVLWSSHTDSVHHKDGYQGIDFDGQFVTLPVNSKSNCLGADDAAGVWIMTQMIQAKVPGLYVFHFAEEVGCVGSRSIRDKAPDLLKGIKSAIAFDRKGTSSVITHQRKRCCSDAFGNSLAEQLPFRFKLDDTGVMTDTRIYMDLVPECTNLSVGYYNEHYPHEALDVNHLFELRDFMVKIDQSKFVIERDPTRKPKPKTKQYSLFGSLGGFRLRDEDTIESLVYFHPNEVASFLESQGITFDELHHAIYGARSPQRLIA
jgi:hypothetical protein